MLISVDRIQPLTHGQRLANDCGKFQLIVDRPRGAVKNGLWVGGCSFVDVLAQRPLHIGSRHNDGTGTPLVCDRKVEEGWGWALIVDDDSAGVFNMLEGAGIVWDLVSPEIRGRRLGSVGGIHLQSRRLLLACAFAPRRCPPHLLGATSRLQAPHCCICLESPSELAAGRLWRGRQTH